MPESPSPREPRRWLKPRAARAVKRLGRIVGIGLLALELLYVIVVNTVLNLPLIPRLISTDDIGMKWTYATSLFPGQATVHGFFMRLQDANIQFTLSIGKTQAHFTLGDLFHRTFHITSVDGRHAVYLMRMRRTPAEVAETDLSTLPLLEGFPAVPLRRAVEPPPSPPATPEQVAAIWTVHIEGVHVVVDEGWFEGLRYRGLSMATGSFTLKPEHLVIVDGHWHVTSGTFTLGHDPLADDIHGDASVRISPFDPQVTPGNEPLRYLDGLLSLEGRLSSARFLDPVLGKTAPHFASDEGNFELYFHFDRAHVGTGTHLRLRAKSWKIGRGRYLVAASYAQLDSAVDLRDGVPTLLTSIDLGPYRVDRLPAADDPGGELVTGDGMLLRLSGSQLDLLGPFLSDLAYELQLHEARMSDLRRLNAYLPGTSDFEVLNGEGTISGDYFSPADSNGHGVLDIGAKDAAFRIQRVRIGSDVSLHLDLSGVASDSERLVIMGNRPLGAKGHIEAQSRIRRPDDLTAAFPPVATSELSGDLTLDPLTLPEIASQGVWRFLSADVSAKGQFESLDFINGFLHGPTPVAIAGGGGSFTIDGRLDHGRIGPESHVDLEADGVQVTWSDYRASTDVGFSVGIRAHPTQSLEGKLGLRKVRLEAGGETLVTADEVSLSGSSARLEMNELMRAPPNLVLRTSRARIPELRALNRFLPADSVRLESGSAEIQAAFDSLPGGEAKGSLGVTLEKASASYEDLLLAGALALSVKAGGLGEAPWRAGIWDRTRLTSSGQIDAHLALRPGPKSTESGLAAFAIKASGELPPLPAGAPPRLQEILHNLVARATVDGELQGIGYMNRFLGGTGLRAEGGNGKLDVSVGFAQGEVASGSWAHLNLDDVALRAGAFALATTTKVTAVVGPEGSNRLSLGLGLDSYELRYVPSSGKPAQDPVLLHGTGLRFELRNDDLDPARFRDASLHAELGDVRVPELRVLNFLLPPSGVAVLTGGQARLTGTLEKPAHGKSKAMLQLKGKKVGVDVSGHALLADFLLTASAATVIPGSGWSPPQSIDLSGSGFSLSNVSFEKELGLQDGWWMAFGLPQASLGLGQAPVVVGKLDLQARDLKPLFSLFNEQLGIPGILTPYLAFEGLHGGANFLVHSGTVEVTEADLLSKRLRLRGRILAGPKGTHGELLLSDPPLDYGVALHEHGTGLQLLGAEGWYEDRLKTPLAQDN